MGEDVLSSPWVVRTESVFVVYFMTLSASLTVYCLMIGRQWIWNAVSGDNWKYCPGIFLGRATADINHGVGVPTEVRKGKYRIHARSFIAWVKFFATKLKNFKASNMKNKVEISKWNWSNGGNFFLRRWWFLSWWRNFLSFVNTEG